MLATLEHHINQLNEALGRAVSWLTLGMVLMMFAVVVRRYLFNAGQPWETELVGFMHGMVFMLAAGYTFRHDAHVRVDVLYSQLSARRKAWVNLLGTLCLLFPFCLLLLFVSWDFVLNSWAMQEASTEYNGMPGIFILKTCVWIFAGSLFLQGVAICIDALLTLREVPHEPALTPDDPFIPKT